MPTLAHISRVAQVKGYLGTRLPAATTACQRQSLHRGCFAAPSGRLGFTLMELMAVVAIIAILATMALPGLQSGKVRDQIVAALPLVSIAEGPVAQAWAATQTFPTDNSSAGLPAADKIVNNAIRAVAIDNGAIHVTFGNSAYPVIAGKVLTLRPAVVDDAPIVPVAWVCGHAAPPDRMTVKGENRTTVPEGFLPFNCRGTGK